MASSCIRPFIKPILAGHFNLTSEGAGIGSLSIMKLLGMQNYQMNHA